MAQARRPAERLQRTLEPALPAVRERERVRLDLVARGERGERAQPLTLGRRAVDRPRERRERAPHRRAPHVLLGEEPRDLVPERARLARRAVVARGLAHEVEPLRRARARGVEEVAVARDPSGLTSRASPSSRRASSSRNGDALRPPRERALLEAEDEHDLEAARARAEEIEHRDAAGLAAVGAAHGRALERADDLVRAQRAAEREPAFELVREARHGLVRAQVEPRVVVRRRLVEAVRVAEHPRGRRRAGRRAASAPRAAP